MTNLMFVLLFSSALIPVSDNLNEISKALSSGNADELARYFDENVEIAIIDKEDVYSREEAKKVVKNFLATYKQSTYSQVHQGTSKGKDSQYTIGNMNANGQTFTV